MRSGPVFRARGASPFSRLRVPTRRHCPEIASRGTRMCRWGVDPSRRSCGCSREGPRSRSRRSPCPTCGSTASSGSSGRETRSFFRATALDPFGRGQAFRVAGFAAEAPYRYGRIGLPLLGWLLALGRPGLVPWTLVRRPPRRDRRDSRTRIRACRRLRRASRSSARWCSCHRSCSCRASFTRSRYLSL